MLYTLTMQNLLSLADQHTPAQIVDFISHALQTEELTLSDVTEKFLSRLWYRENQQTVFPLLIAQLPMEQGLAIINFLRSLPGQEESFVNIFLAAECFRMIRQKYPILTVESQPELYWQVKKLASYGNFFLLLYQSGQDLQKFYQIRIKAVQAIAQTWQDHPETEIWLENIVKSEAPGEVRAVALKGLLNKFPAHRADWLKDLVLHDTSPILREVAILELSEIMPNLDWQFWHNLVLFDYNPAVRKTSLETLVRLHPDQATAELLQRLMATDENQGVRTKAMELLGHFYQQNSETLPTLKAWLKTGNRTECLSAVTILVEYYPDLPELPALIQDLILNSSHVDVEQQALLALSSIYPVDQLIPFCCSLMTENTVSNLRETIVNLLAKVSQQKPDILAYLQNVAESDPDIMVREATVKAIAENWSGDQSIYDFLRKIADHDPYWLVQQCAVTAIARYGAKNADTLCWLQDVAVSGSQLNVREIAVQEIAKGWGNDPNVQIFLQNLAEETEENNLVNVIVQAIAKNWGDQPVIIPWLEGWLNSDRADVRQTVLQTMFYTATNPPYQLLENLATADSITGVRQLALQKLARYHHDNINTLVTIKTIAKTDSDARVRVTALVELLRGWKDHPDIFEFFCQRAIYDPYHQNDCFLNNPRFTALEILIEHYADQPKTIQIVHDRAINDPDEQIRGLAQKKLE